MKTKTNVNPETTVYTIKADGTHNIPADIYQTIKNASSSADYMLHVYNGLNARGIYILDERSLDNINAEQAQWDIERSAERAWLQHKGRRSYAETATVAAPKVTQRVKAEPKHVLIAEPDGMTFYAASEHSAPGRFWQQVVGVDGSVSCNCPARVKCWHIIEAERIIAAQVIEAAHLSADGLAEDWLGEMQNLSQQNIEPNVADHQLLCTKAHKTLGRLVDMLFRDEVVNIEWFNTVFDAWHVVQ